MTASWEIGARSDSTPFRAFLVSPEKIGGSPPLTSISSKERGQG
jgi:hypothetical protein